MWFDIERDEKERKFFITADDKKVRTFDGSFEVCSTNRELLEFIIDDFDRCGEVDFNDAGGIEFNGVPCAYAIYCDNVSHQSDQVELQNLIRLWPLYDECLVPISQGPEGAEQLGRYLPLHHALEQLIGNDLTKQLLLYVEAMPYRTDAFDQGNEGEDWDHFEFISDDDFVKTEVSDALADAFANLSDNQKAAVLGLNALLGHRKFTLSLCYVLGLLSWPAFLKIVKFASNFICLDGELDSHFRTEREEQYCNTHGIDYDFDTELPPDIQAEIDKGVEADIRQWVLERDSYLETTANLCLHYSRFDDDPILARIKSGESKTQEFKSTFTLCLKSKTSERHIEHSAMKSIVGFENAEGGSLLIGVSDDGEIIGVDQEIEKLFKGSKDKYLLRIKDRLKASLTQGLANISMNLHKVGGKHILVFDVLKAKEPSYLLNGKVEEFYARTGPSTEKLEASKLVSYIRQHFPS